MRKSNLKLVFPFLVVAMVAMTFFYCRKSEVPPDPNLSIVGTRQLVVSALNANSTDSIGQFSVTITTPTSTVTQVATGNTYVLKDIVAGTYTVVVTKTGYVNSEAKTYSVTLPSDPKVSLVVTASIPLTKTAAPVTVTGSSGGVIAVKENSEVASSATVVNATVAPATVFTLADGTKPASVAISVSNVPVNASVAPVINAQIQLSTGVEVIQNQIPLQKLDLQPSGLQLSVPMTIDIYIGDTYPTTMPVAEKTARQNGLSLNYVKADGTVEKVLPDHFSTDRNTVFYKITHFSQWNLTSGQTMTKASPFLTYSPEVTISASKCGDALPKGHLRYEKVYSQGTPNLAWLLTGEKNNVSYFTSPEFATMNAQPGYWAKASMIVQVENWILTDVFSGITYPITIPTQNCTINYTYDVCHNQ